MAGPRVGRHPLVARHGGGWHHVPLHPVLPAVRQGLRLTLHRQAGAAGGGLVKVVVVVGVEVVVMVVASVEEVVMCVEEVVMMVVGVEVVVMVVVGVEEVATWRGGAVVPVS